MPNDLTTEFQLKRLDGKIHELEQRLANVSAETAEAADAFGDLIDNAEFEYSAKQEHLVVHQLRDLRSQRERLTVMSTNDIDLNSATIGTSVEVLDIATRKPHKYNLVGLGPVDLDQNEISYKSPIGQALYGLRRGHFCKVNTPKETLELLVLEISIYTPSS